MDMHVKIQRFLQEMGGAKAVSEGLKNASPTTVYSWVTRGNIPSWRLEPLHKLAQAKNVKVPGWVLKQMKELDLTV
jgi:hypothetical protein